MKSSFLKGFFRLCLGTGLFSTFLNSFNPHFHLFKTFVHLSSAEFQLLTKLRHPILGLVARAASRLNRPLPVFLHDLSLISQSFHPSSDVHITGLSALFPDQVHRYRHTSGCAHLVGLLPLYRI